ncbi:hypothetical protein ACFOY4_33590 [Actinomadura syzygii]|uniref:Uncharacterized protein n=1 Tax=Actinomadura syzygii TaxID=1427538 RepID=A0A5D0UB81_9ACTN|nr:hypothetical protein [Actinomadura syzygii]TYC15006.1 hypothetical protein FXF65_12820 [Actinomadura syzygii]
MDGPRPTAAGLGLLVGLPVGVVEAERDRQAGGDPDAVFTMPRAWTRRSRRNTQKARAALGYHAPLVEVLDWLAERSADR